MGKFTQSFRRPLVRAALCMVGAGALSSLPDFGQVPMLRLVLGIHDAYAKKERAKDPSSTLEVLKSEPLPSADGSPWSQSTPMRVRSRQSPARNPATLPVNRMAKLFLALCTAY
jgi:hypothetical protein